MCKLPFTDSAFDKVYSMTAIEFVEDGRLVVEELERVAKSCGTVVLTTLNRLSPWAESRLQKARNGHELFKSMIFRSPAEMRKLVPADAEVKTAIHFQKTDDPVQARRIEDQGSAEGRETGAFLAVCWTKK
jgi:ubiquinone/menaquinone biosynthesis C-methylase UbiE